MIPTEVFPSSDLPWKLQTDVHTNRRRKVPVDELENCPVKKLVQWKCHPDGTLVRCHPIERFFRTCKDLTVEVTEFKRAMNDTKGGCYGR